VAVRGAAGGRAGRNAGLIYYNKFMRIFQTRNGFVNNL
jgi:hypothetical protein